MRRSLLLAVLTVGCWGFAMACGGDGAPQSPVGTADPVSGASGQINPLVPGTGGDGEGSGGVNIPIIPVPVIALTIDGKPVVQDGLYAATELKVHASDAKGQATMFHWTLMGTGINGGLFADGAEASFKLPAVTDKSAYELTAIGSLGGKAVQQTINFFTVPAPTANIIANMNQAGGIVVKLPEDGSGIVLKGQKIQFSANAKFADTLKWKIAKNNGAAEDLDPSKDFIASDIGSYKVLLMAFGPGGNTGPQPLELKFSAKDNAAAITITSQVSKLPDFVSLLKPPFEYPVGSTIAVDGSGIGSALEVMQCAIKNDANVAVPATQQSKDKFEFVINAAGIYQLSCTYTLKEGYVALGKEPLEGGVAFKILPKIVAVIHAGNQLCDPKTPLYYAVSNTPITLDASASTGNVAPLKSTWIYTLGGVPKGGGSGLQFPIKLDVPGDYFVQFKASGVGDSGTTSCTVVAKPKPAVKISANSTVQTGRSYVAGSHQLAHADVTSGTPDLFSWKLSDQKGTSGTTEEAAKNFEFGLTDVGDLTLTLTPSDKGIAGGANSVSFTSKLGQLSLITPSDFSNIQSIAAVGNSDVYFASPTAIFHKGKDGRVVQVKNIATIGDTHPAVPNGFFARNAGDIYLLTTDGGYWRYTFKNGWVFSPKGAGANQLAIAGDVTGTRLFVVANSRLHSGDADVGTWTKIGDGQRYVTYRSGNAYAAASVSTGAGPAVVKCTPAACTPLKWKADPMVVVTWKSIGAGTSAVYVSDANSRVYAVQNDLVALYGTLKNDDYIVSYAPRGDMVYAIGNKGGVYNIDPAGVTPLFVSPMTVTSAAGVVPEFWVWDSIQKKVFFVKDANPSVVSAQPTLGTSVAPCVDQKQMWMVEDVAYVSVCSVIAGKLPLYTVWATPYQGDVTTNLKLQAPTPVVGVASDGAEGLLVMRSDGANTNYIQNLKADGTLEVLKVALNGGEFFTDMSGKFFITNQGIRVNHAPDYLLVQLVADAHHPFADGEKLYFSKNNDARLARFDLTQSTLEDLANVDPQDPIVDVTMGYLNRVYVMTAKAVYRYDGNGVLTTVYNTLGNAPLLNSMAIMNGKHALVSFGSKGLALIAITGNDAPVQISPNVEMGLAADVWSVGYNGTEFLFYGRDFQTNTLFLHQYGAPQ